MCARTPFRQAGNSIALLLAFTLSIALNLTGCRDSTTTAPRNSVGMAASDAADTSEAETIPAGDASSMDTTNNSSVVLGGSQLQNLSASQSSTGRQTPTVTDAPSTELSLAIPTADQQPTIQPGLSPRQLRKLRADIDYNLRVLVSGQSGISDAREAREKLLNYINMKLEASRRLAAHEDSSPAEKSEGARGEIQAMSHLASVGNVSVAEELEKIALSNLSSDDPGLVSDSRLILIGFALEDLKNGKEDAAPTIIDYFQQIKDAKSKPDVPTLMIMGMAREDLANAGYEEQAKSVRKMIIDLYADSPDPAIAEMAASLAGNVTFATIEKQRAALVSGTPEPAEQVTVEQWSQSVDTLIAESPDLQTVQYLAAAALEFEGLKREDLVDATYASLTSAFTDSSSASSKEISLAQEARQSRKNIIGKNFTWELPKTDGKKMSISEFAGKIVLMPFWAQAFPPSLSIIPQLKTICAKHPDQVVIVGVNLDPEGTDVQPFINKSQLNFFSLRSESSPTQEISNQIAHDFGMVSLPFVAILDEKGVVQGLNFTGQNLDTQVTNLLNR